MQVWYASYGSNLRRDRFLHYIAGGRPEGASRTYPGARDRTPPVDDRPLTLPGAMFFGWESPTWGGGIAFYNADSEGPTLARAYLVSDQQFADVAAQEMHRQPGDDLDLGQVLEHSRHDLGPGRYEALHLVGELEGAPVLTFTTPDPAALQLNSPTAAYLRMIVAGLRETHGSSDDEVLDYLLARPGLGDEWWRDRLAGLLSG
ncbi:hypothetical protein SAMN04489867_0487 [Pedococcus dokdonensis]|uniref:Histone deacetylase n=1 Tax=Pedococcus dokdonensis TaxID=443156 RepID=A0A1H0M3G0_9MICO|nr:hypothetical protein [Pedococcus dokdonensis]SDO74927.1 hypothetical protein SAMN04489867_0487 [Pedococcus dokdonensis]